MTQGVVQIVRQHGGVRVAAGDDRRRPRKQHEQRAAFEREQQQPE